MSLRLDSHQIHSLKKSDQLFYQCLGLLRRNILVRMDQSFHPDEYAADIRRQPPAANRILHAAGHVSRTGNSLLVAERIFVDERRDRNEQAVHDRPRDFQCLRILFPRIIFAQPAQQPAMPGQLLFVDLPFVDRTEIAFGVQVFGQQADQFAEVFRLAMRSASVEHQGENRPPLLVAGPSARLLFGPIDLFRLIQFGFHPVEIAAQAIAQFTADRNVLESGRSQRPIPVLQATRHKTG